MALSIDIEVAHLDRACCERVVTHLRYSTGKHIDQRGFAHIGSADQSNLYMQKAVI